MLPPLAEDLESHLDFLSAGRRLKPRPRMLHARQVADQRCRSTRARDTRASGGRALVVT